MEGTTTPRHKPSHAGLRMLVIAAAVGLVGGAGELTAEAITQACLDSYCYGQSVERGEAELCVRGGDLPRPFVAETSWGASTVTVHRSRA